MFVIHSSIHIIVDMDVLGLMTLNEKKSKRLDQACLIL